MRRAFVCLIIGTGLGIAATKPSLAASPAPYYWAGPYIGVSAGGIWSAQTVNPVVTGTPGPNATPIQHAVAAASFDTTGASPIFGLELGDNWQFNRWVAGIEADFSGAELHSSVTQSFNTPTRAVHTVTSAFEKDLDELGTLRGRAGFLATDTILVYGTGGLAYGRTPTSYDVSSPNGGGVGGPNPFNVLAADSDWRIGWTAGAGLEYALLNGWNAKVEYLHYDLGTEKLTVTNPTAVSNFTSSVNPSFKGDLVRIGLDHKL
jgi:outer membrane immunogenic protein